MLDPMREPIATITWCAADVKHIRPDWSDDKCLDALSSVGLRLEECSIDHGWSILEILLNHYLEQEY